MGYAVAVVVVAVVSFFLVRKLRFYTKSKRLRQKVAHDVAITRRDIEEEK